MPARSVTVSRLLLYKILTRVSHPSYTSVANVRVNQWPTFSMFLSRFCFSSDVGSLPRLVSAFKTVMDYIIAGFASLFLFAYLVYALLRAERF